MAKVFKCDRCGHIYEEGVFDVGTYCVSKVRTTYMTLKLDLCPKCITDLQYFMNNANVYVGAGDNRCT